MIYHFGTPIDNKNAIDLLLNELIKLKKKRIILSLQNAFLQMKQLKSYMCKFRVVFQNQYFAF